MIISQLIVPLAMLVAAMPAFDGRRPISQSTGACTVTTGLRDYTGRFGRDNPSSESVITVTIRDGDLTMRPALWSGLVHLEEAGRDSFVAVHYGRPGARFRRDSAGCVVGLDLLGTAPGGYHARLGEKTWPIEWLVNGDGRRAARALAEMDTVSTERLVRIATRVATMPTRVTYAADFLDEVAKRRPNESQVHAALGNVLVAGRRRAQASAAYRRALALDSSNAVAQAGLARLSGVAARMGEDGWRLPFSLSAFFATPNATEISRVVATWRQRDLSPKHVEPVVHHAVVVEGVRADVRVVTHEVLGARHTGVIIVPEGATAGCCPIIVEAKGVSPSFPPLDVPGDLTAPFVMGPERSKFIYVVPGFRGEWVKIGRDSILSEGDRNSAWDGATDDLIALLAVAKQITPEADTSRICAFGRSRGGAVALLAGVREPSIDCVVSWAAPTEWLELMGTEGWTQRELVSDGLRRRSAPGEVGGQFIGYFLSGAIAGRDDLTTARRRVIASSALHFADRIPLTQAHWAEDDASVPVINGRRFVERFRATRGSACLDARFHAEAGHDQDRQRAPRQSREFILRAFAMSDSALQRCRKVSSS